MITLITPTGGRPEAFKLCHHFVTSQTYKGPMQWLIIDDVHPPTLPLISHPQADYHPAQRKWTQGVNTHRFNMEEALKYINPKSEFIFFIEDDDYYAPSYIDSMLSLCKHSDIAGLSNSRYYGLHVPGWKMMNNYLHASLSQTVIRKSMIPRFSAAVNSGDLYFDSYMWKRVFEDKVPFSLLANSNIGIGIKGMPGREGITGSHKDKGYYVDVGFGKLKEWIGKDYMLYLPFARGGSKKVESLKAVPPSKGGTISAPNNPKQTIKSTGAANVTAKPRPNI